MSDDFGRFGPDQPNYNATRYPLMIRDPVNAALEDLHISWISDAEPIIALKWVGGVSEDMGDNGTDLLLQATNGQIFDTKTMEHTSRIWIHDLRVHLWKNDFVVIQAVIRHDPSLETQYTVANAEVDLRAVECLPPSIMDILIKQPDGGFASAVRGDQTYRFKEGYNSKLTYSAILSDRQERVSRIELAAATGSGIGRFPDCNSNVGITSLGGANPTIDGDLLFQGDSCLHVKPVLDWSGSSATVVDGQFEIIDTCHAPCSCEDITDVTNYAMTTWSRFKVIASRVAGVQQGYADLRDRVLAVQEQVASSPLRAMIWDAAPCALGLGAGFSNVSDAVVPSLILRVRILDTSDNVVGIKLAKSSGYRVAYSNGVAYNKVEPLDYNASTGTLTIELTDIAVDEMGFMYARLELDYCQQEGYIQVQVDASPDGWKDIPAVRADFDFSGRSV